MDPPQPSHHGTCHYYGPLIPRDSIGDDRNEALAFPFEGVNTLPGLFKNSVATVDVKFDIAGVRHNPQNRRFNTRNWCWCRRQQIDEDTVPMEPIIKREIEDYVVEKEYVSE